MGKGGFNFYVDKHAVERFRKLSCTQKLRWLEEVHKFLSSALPPESRRIMDALRKGEDIKKIIPQRGWKSS